MKYLPEHLNWLIDTRQELKTADAKSVRILEFQYQDNNKILSSWAKHFRNHYCLDSEIDTLRNGTGYSRKEYLNEIKFPDALVAPGPSIRAGDFGEILVADFLQYSLDYWVPRSRYCDKSIRNESTKGCDIIGFRIANEEQDSTKDTLAVFEVKASFSGNKSDNKLQEAVSGSAKDVIRKAESLNAVKQRALNKNQTKQVTLIERFQNIADRPYQELSGAVALFSTDCYTPILASQTDTSIHPNKDNLILIIIHGPEMMKLVHELYRRSADEA